MNYRISTNENPSFEDRETKREDYLADQERVRALAAVGIKKIGSGGRHLVEPENRIYKTDYEEKQAIFANQKDGEPIVLVGNGRHRLRVNNEESDVA